jgi:uncharacterized protein YjbI with pentapeptide repeats
LTGVIAAQADFTDAMMKGCRLSRANLHQARLAGANLENADLSGCNLTGASLAGAVLVGTRMDLAVTDGADLSGALTGEAAGRNLCCCPFPSMSCWRRMRAGSRPTGARASPPIFLGWTCAGCRRSAAGR